MKRVIPFALTAALVVLAACATTSAPIAPRFDPSGYFSPTPPLPNPLDSLEWIAVWVTDPEANPPSMEGSLRVVDPGSSLGFRDVPLSNLVVDHPTLAFDAPTFPGGPLSFRGRFLASGTFADLPDQMLALEGQFSSQSGRATSARFVYWVGD